MWYTGYIDHLVSNWPSPVKHYDQVRSKKPRNKALNDHEEKHEHELELEHDSTQ